MCTLYSTFLKPPRDLTLVKHHYVLRLLKKQRRKSRSDEGGSQRYGNFTFKTFILNQPLSIVPTVGIGRMT